MKELKKFVSDVKIYFLVTTSPQHVKHSPICRYCLPGQNWSQTGGPLLCLQMRCYLTLGTTFTMKSNYCLKQLVATALTGMCTVDIQN